jgi:hypothetical protein
MSLALMPARPPYVEFEERSEEDRDATIKAGRLVMRDIDYAVVRQIGSKDAVEKSAVDWLNQLDKMAFIGGYPKEWAQGFRQKYDAWKQGRAAPLNGSPLRTWPRMSKAKAENYATLGMFTVEDVAAMNEQTMQRIGMGARSDKDAATAFLEERAGTINSEEVAALRAELADQKQRNSDLQQAIAEIRAELPKKKQG